MWLSRIAGFALDCVSVAIIAFLAMEVWDRSGQSSFVYAIGLPAFLLLVVAALIGVLFGTLLMERPAEDRRHLLLRRMGRRPPHA